MSKVSLPLNPSRTFKQMVNRTSCDEHCTATVKDDVSATADSHLRFLTNDSRFSGDLVADYGSWAAGGTFRTGRKIILCFSVNYVDDGGLFSPDSSKQTRIHGTGVFVVFVFINSDNDLVGLVDSSTVATSLDIRSISAFMVSVVAMTILNPDPTSD